MKRILMLIAVATLSAVAIAPVAQATNGYFTHGTGTLSKGMAGAAIAMPREAMDTAANPAAAAWIEELRTIPSSPRATSTITGGFPPGNRSSARIPPTARPLNQRKLRRTSI